MKKVFISVALALMVVPALHARQRLDAQSRMIIENYRIMQRDPSAALIPASEMPFEVNPASRAEPEVSALVIIADNTTVADVESYGVEVLSEVGDVLVVTGPLSAIEELGLSDAVVEVSLQQKVKLNMDFARPASQVTAAQDGTDLPQAFTGKGVLTSIFDQGMDPNHVNFTNATPQSRVIQLYHFTGSNGAFKEYSGDQVSSFTTDLRSESHGTHTMGIMAGSFNKGDGKGKTAVMTMKDNDTPASIRVTANAKNPYYGVATQSEIVAACGQLYTSNTSVGIEKLHDYVMASGKPGVMNLSIGSSVGPHDGTDATSRLINNIAADMPVCVSSGNEGDLPATLRGTNYQTFLLPYQGRAFNGIIDIWSKDATPLKVTIVVYDKSAKNIVASFVVEGNSSGVVTTSNYTDPSYQHNTYFDRAFTSSSVQYTSGVQQSNNRYNAYLYANIQYNSATNPSANYLLGFIVEGSVQSDMFLNSDYAYLGSGGIAGWQTGNADMSISNFACGDNVISVGSYNTRRFWPTLGKTYFSFNKNQGYDVDEVSGFSSYGELLDGRKLPTLCAPGCAIISSFNSYNTALSNDEAAALYNYNSRAYYWGEMQGTSMSSPFAAGVVGLMLEADGTLTPSQVRDILKKTAVKQEGYYNASNAMRWGAGRIDAVAAIREVLSGAGIYDVVADAKDAFMLRTMGVNVFEASLPGATSMTAALYNPAGQLVMKTSAEGDVITVDANAVSAGIYILNVNGAHSSRVVIR